MNFLVEFTLFVAKHEDSKTREKNVCRGRMIELSTEMVRVAEVDRGILWDEEGN